MNWEKYAKMVSRDPMIDYCLSEHVGPPMLHHGGSHPDFTLREWVEQKLKYVAVRPWSSLDMNLTDSTTCRSSSRHVIHLHIANSGDRRAARARYVDNQDEPTRSIAQAMSSLAEWHSEYWAKQQDRPLVIDAVLRRSVLWQPVSPYTDQVLAETINIWLPPEGFQP